jgi:MFS family permease
VQSAIALEALVSAAFILIGSKVADLWSRKKAYVLGLLAYAVGALAMTLAQSLTAIIIFWAIIGGFGASLLLPACRRWEWDVLRSASWPGRRAYSEAGTVRGTAPPAALDGECLPLFRSLGYGRHGGAGLGAATLSAPSAPFLARERSADIRTIAAPIGADRISPTAPNNAPPAIVRTRTASGWIPRAAP